MVWSLFAVSVFNFFSLQHRNLEPGGCQMDSSLLPSTFPAKNIVIFPGLSVANKPLCCKVGFVRLVKQQREFYQELTVTKLNKMSLCEAQLHELILTVCSGGITTL